MIIATFFNWNKDSLIFNKDTGAMEVEITAKKKRSKIKKALSLYRKKFKTIKGWTFKHSDGSLRLDIVVK